MHVFIQVALPALQASLMERSTNMDTNESVNHLPSRKRAGSKDDYRALLDSTEQKQQYEYVRRTPFGVVSLAHKPLSHNWAVSLPYR